MPDTWALRAGHLYDGEHLLGPATVLVCDGVVIDVGEYLCGDFAVIDLGEDVTVLPRGKGRVGRGADADLLAVRGDLPADPDAVQDVIGVWQAGVRIR
jgi:imidazolonepropionase-like amidohydrolase